MAAVRHRVFLVSVPDACNWYAFRFEIIPWTSHEHCANDHLVSNMNYTCVVVGGFLSIELAWWLIAGKRYSATVQRAREEGTRDTVVVDNGKTDD